MKRDLDLMRDMMLRIESLCPSPGKITSDSFTDLCSDKDKIGFHLFLLYDVGFIVAEPVNHSKMRCSDYIVEYLTFIGCDYLDSIRDQSVWNSIKEKLRRIGGNATLDILTDLASSLLREQLGM